MTVQILRFKDGLDVICQTTDSENHMEIVNPMVFHIRNGNLILQHWLPLTVMKGNSVIINKSEILCKMFPSDDFSEYYEEMAKKIKEVTTEDLDPNVSEEELMDIMEAVSELENSKNLIKH